MPRYRKAQPVLVHFGELVEQGLVLGSNNAEKPVSYYVVGHHFGCHFWHWANSGGSSPQPTWLEECKADKEHVAIARKIGVDIDNQWL